MPEANSSPGELVGGTTLSTESVSAGACPGSTWEGLAEDWMHFPHDWQGRENHLLQSHDTSTISKTVSD